MRGEEEEPFIPAEQFVDGSVLKDEGHTTPEMGKPERVLESRVTLLVSIPINIICMRLIKTVRFILTVLHKTVHFILMVFLFHSILYTWTARTLNR